MTFLGFFLILLASCTHKAALVSGPLLIGSSCVSRPASSIGRLLKGLKHGQRAFGKRSQCWAVRRNGSSPRGASVRSLAECGSPLAPAWRFLAVSCSIHFTTRGPSPPRRPLEPLESPPYPMCRSLEPTRAQSVAHRDTIPIPAAHVCALANTTRHELQSDEQAVVRTMCEIAVYYGNRRIGPEFVLCHAALPVYPREHWLRYRGLTGRKGDRPERTDANAYSRSLDFANTESAASCAFR